MERAALSDDGWVRWTETCYCTPPLKHERETVLDDHFDAMEIAPAEAHERVVGTPLMAHLRRVVDG